MKKILITFCFLFVLGCTATTSTDKEKTSPMDRVGQALEKIQLPKF